MVALLCNDERAGDEQAPLAPAPTPARAKGGEPLPEPTPAGSGLCDSDACCNFWTAFGSVRICSGLLALPLPFF